MPTKMFVNLPVEDLDRSEEFFAALGFDFFAVTEGMASVIISDHTQVMLLTAAVFAGYASRPVADATESTEVILVLGVEDRASVDRLVDTAVAGGGSPAGTPQDSNG